MNKIEFFEPAMCCESGLCGVTIDPTLLRISTFLKRLKAKGYEVKRYNLNSAPMEFVNNKVANDFVNKNGVDKLPIILVNGEIVMQGKYPTNEELLKYLGLQEGDLA